MSELLDALLQTFLIWSDNQASALKFDRTILCTVHSIDNVDTGAYYVRYQGNIFLAYSTDSKTYKVNLRVYVTILEGDFTQKKLILRAADDTSLTAAEYMRLLNSILEVSPELNELYGGDMYDPTIRRGVIAGATAAGDTSHGEIYIYQGSEKYQPTDFHGLFQLYANNYEYIQIKASFTTELYTLFATGNYGIKIEFYAKDDNVVSFALDVTNFNGSYYRFVSPSEQSVVVKTQKNYLLGLKSIKLFERFPNYDVKSTADIDTTNYNTDVANIFVEDIAVKFVDYIDLSQVEYYLTISTPRGVAFASNVSTLSLVGQLIYKGDKITDKCEWKWYLRDVSITTGAEGYNKDVGVGWAPLANGQTLELTSDKVAHAQSYKLLLVYNNEVVLTKEIKIYNHLSTEDFKIVQTTNGDKIYLSISDEDLSGEWYISYPDGRYEYLASGPSVEIAERLQYSNLIFYCAVYRESTYLDTLTHQMANSESENDVTISYEGEDTFRYDANGDFAWEGTEKERNLSVNLTWKEGYGTSYRVEWVSPDGTVLVPGAAAIPVTNSMIEDLRVDNSSILYYHIKLKYKINYNNNTITVRIITINGAEPYEFKKEILFLKDGDLGTNGTTYVMAIRPCDIHGVKVSEYRNMVLTHDGSLWTKSKLPLHCYIYKDGERIDTNENYSIYYRWTGINLLLVDLDDVELDPTTAEPNQVYANGLGNPIGTASADLLYYVKCQADIYDNLNGRNVSIYSSYPVDIVVGSLSLDGIELDIPSYIKYNAAGTVPSFYSGNISLVYNEHDYSSNISSINEKLLKIEETDSLYYLKPASSFIFEKTNGESDIAVMKCKVDNNSFILHSIVMYLDAYGKEAINSWDGTRLEINEDEGYIYAPQVGAGEKDSLNRFTGVVMGVNSSPYESGSANKVGLYGFSEGINTFGLTEEGQAYFGSKASGGQVFIDGTGAKIGGGDAILVSATGNSKLREPTNNGMLITLANNTDSTSAKAIIVGNQDTFYVNYAGKLYATEAEIEGNIYAGGGYIGRSEKNARDGWKIELLRLSSDDGKVGMYAGKDSNYEVTYKEEVGELQVTKTHGYVRFWAGNSGRKTAPFYVTDLGFLHATDAEISGTINASKGTIGSWLIENGVLKSLSGKITLSTSSITVGDKTTNYYFEATSSGQVNASGVNISGTITATTLSANYGLIGGWNIGEGYLSAGSTFLYDTGVIQGAVIRGSSFLDNSGSSTLSLTSGGSEGGILLFAQEGHALLEIWGWLDRYDSAGMLEFYLGNALYMEFDKDEGISLHKRLCLSSANYGSTEPTGDGYPGLIYFQY